MELLCGKLGMILLGIFCFLVGALVAIVASRKNIKSKRPRWLALILLSVGSFLVSAQLLFPKVLEDHFSLLRYVIKGVAIMMPVYVSVAADFVRSLRRRGHHPSANQQSSSIP